MIATAINEIEYGPGGDRKFAHPGQVFDVPEAEYSRLVKMGAVREPTPEERALSRMVADTTPETPETPEAEAEAEERPRRRKTSA